VVVAVVFGVLLVLAGALVLQRRGGDLAGEQGRVREPQMFAEDLEREVLHSGRSGQPACLVLLRVEPASGSDELLDVMARELRAVDLRYRLDGDEFALILPDTRARGGLIAAGRVEESLLLTSDATTLAAGVAELGPGIYGEQLLRNARHALTLAGRHGHSTVLEFSPLLDDEIEPAHGSHRSHR
jgi:PelD GGDEF domain/Diguanylate cyclase, GGDEF domain